MILCMHHVDSSSDRPRTRKVQLFLAPRPLGSVSGVTPDTRCAGRGLRVQHVPGRDVRNWIR